MFAKMEQAARALVSGSASDPVVVVKALVNSVPMHVVADTGAARSLCNKEDALLLTLEQDPDVPNKQFTGLGDLPGAAARPVLLVLPKASAHVQFYIVDKPKMPLILGKHDLSGMQLLVDTVDNTLIYKETFEVVALGIDSPEGTSVGQ